MKELLSFGSESMTATLLCALLILVVSAVAGIREGFVRCIFVTFTLVLALGAAAFFGPKLSDVLLKNDDVVTFTRKHITLEDSQISTGTTSSENENTSGTDSKTPEAIRNLKVPQALKGILSSGTSAKKLKEFNAAELKEYLLQNLTAVVIRTLSIIFVFVLVEAVLLILCCALDLFTKLPVLNELNHAAGVFGGILRGLLILWVLGVVVTFFGGTGLGQKILAEIAASRILSTIYNTNLLLKLL